MDVDLKAEVERFGVVARNYCQLLESSEEFSAGEFLNKARILVAELIVAGANLPHPEPTSGEISDAQIDRDVETQIGHRLQRKLGNLGFYHHVFDPTENEETVGSLISLDLAEIYGDLQEGFGLTKVGETTENILWTWRFSFDTYWGRHAVSVLAAIHTLIADGHIFVKE